MPSTLDDRRILVTGASAGIGEATARACAEAGAEVAVVARRRERLERLSEEIGAVPIASDLTDEDAARDAVESAAQRLGGLDGIVNNAGIFRPSLVSEGRVSDWRAMFDLNVLALLTVTHSALPHLREAGRGDIVNVSSLSGRRVPNAAAGVYSATKFAVYAMSEGLRQELHEDGIRVSVVSPGLVETEILDGDDHDAAVRVRDAAKIRGLIADEVAAEIVHVLGRPPHVLLRETTMSNLSQGS